MRLLKSITTICMVTIIALVYVHQQVELVKMSYSINYKERVLKDALDRKEGLSYNVANLEDPSRLEDVLLAKKIDITFPKRDQVIRSQKLYTAANVGNGLRAVSVDRKGYMVGILEFLGLRAEAHAREQ